jgi:membrane protein implicated in regulation of membrane protease activity
MGSIVEFFSNEPGWIWLIIAVALFALDVLAPGFFMLWFGFAATVVGLLVFAVPLEPLWQILAFCAACIISLLIGRALWGGRRANVSDKPFLNQRAQQLVGRTFVLATAIQGGQGRITAGDGLWSVRGPDLPVGSLVRVTDSDGTILIVEATEAS